MKKNVMKQIHQMQDYLDYAMHQNICRILGPLN